MSEGGGCELQIPSADASLTVLVSIASQSVVPTSLTYAAPPLTAPNAVTHVELAMGSSSPAAKFYLLPIP